MKQNHGFSARGSSAAAILAMALLGVGEVSLLEAAARHPEDIGPEEDIKARAGSAPRQAEVEEFGKKARKEYSHVLRETGNRELALEAGRKIQEGA